MPASPIELAKLEGITANIYEAIIVAARQARNINDDQKIEFNQLLQTVPVTGGEEEGEDLTNPAQMKISMEFEAREKPHIQALHQLLNGEVEFKYKNKEGAE